MFHQDTSPSSPSEQALLEELYGAEGASRSDASMCPLTEGIDDSLQDIVPPMMVGVPHSHQEAIDQATHAMVGTTSQGLTLLNDEAFGDWSGLDEDDLPTPPQERFEALLDQCGGGGGGGDTLLEEDIFDRLHRETTLRERGVEFMDQISAHTPTSLPTMWHPMAPSFSSIMSLAPDPSPERVMENLLTIQNALMMEPKPTCSNAMEVEPAPSSYLDDEAPITTTTTNEEEDVANDDALKSPPRLLEEEVATSPASGTGTWSLCSPSSPREEKNEEAMEVESRVQDEDTSSCTDIGGLP